MTDVNEIRLTRADNGWILNFASVTPAALDLSGGQQPQVDIKTLVFPDIYQALAHIKKNSEPLHPRAVPPVKDET